MLLAVLFAPIQLEHRIATVTAIVEELAQKSGKRIAVKHEMADEVLYVNLMPHTSEELMALIAKAASAEWIDDGGLYLGRSATLRRQQERDDRSSIAASLQVTRQTLLAGNDFSPWPEGRGRFDRLVDATKTLPGTQTPTQFWTRMARLGSFSPIGRLLSRTLRDLPLQDLAEIPPGYTERFALSPTRRQRRLPPSIGVEQYRSERAMFAQDLKRAGDQAWSQVSEYTFSYRRELDPGEQLTPLLTVRRETLGASFLVRLAVLDRKGQAIDSATLSLMFGHDDEAAKLPGYRDWSRNPVKVGPPAASFVASMTGKPVDPQEARRLREPVKNEPLAVLLSDPVDAMKVAMGVQEAIVALPDETARDAGMELESEPKLGEFADGLTMDVASEVTHGLWLGRARRPSESTVCKTSRSALQTYIRSSMNPIPTLAQTARYALAQNPEASVTWFERLVINATGVDMGIGSLGTLDEVENGGRDLLRVYGSLSPAQRTTLEQGQPIPLSQITPAARAMLETVVFRRDVQLEAAERATVPQAMPDVDASFLIDSLSPQSTLWIDRPRTVLCTAYLRSGTLRTMDMSSLGYVHEAQEHDGSFTELDGYPIVSRTLFTPARYRNFGFRLAATPTYGHRSYLTDFAVDPGARGVSYRQLPPEHLKEFQKTFDYYRQSRKGG